MNEYDDEDVILPSSPLYQYFKEPSLEKENQIDKITERQSLFWTLFCSFRGCVDGVFQSMKDAIKAISSPIYNYFRVQHDIVQESIFNNVLSTFKNKRLMIPEDVVFLESYSADFSNTKVARINVLLCLPFSAMCVGLISCIYGITAENYFVTVNNYLNRKVTLLLSSCCVSFCGWYLVLLLYHHTKKRSICKKLKELGTCMEHLTSNFKNSLRLIQEFELIARGFACVSTPDVAQRLELAQSLPITFTDRQLPEFRILLFSWIRQIYFKYRSSTLDLISKFSIPTDCSSSYIATVDLKEFGSLLNCDPVEKCDQLLKASDNLSLSSLKAVCQLMQVQMSEFLRRLCLVFLSMLDNIDVNYIVTFKKLNALIHIIEGTVVHNTDVLILAVRSYSYYRSIGKSRTISDVHHIALEQTPLRDLQIIVHDLTLHLNAVLTQVLAVEDFLNGEPNYKSQLELSSSVLEKLELSFEQIKTKLSGCDYSLKQCLDHVENLCNKNVDSVEKVDISHLVNLRDEKLDNRHVNIIPDSIPVIEDEVFEAVVSKTDSNDENSFSLDNDSKPDKKFSIHLMKELKTVLVAKSEEHRSREEKALKAHIKKEGNNTNENLNVGSFAVSDKNNSDFPEGVPIENSVEDQSEKCGSNDFATTGCDGDTQRALKSERNVKLPREMPFLCNESEDDICQHEDLSVERNKYEVPEKDHEGQSSQYVFRPVGTISFASSIAALASQRQKLFNLEDQTYEFSKEDASNS